MDHWEKDFNRFYEMMEDRMWKGEHEYGNTSFKTTPKETITEIQEELLDVANWSFILWRKLDNIIV